MTKPLFALDATEMLAGYATGAFTPTEVMRALNAHIARWEPTLGALYLWRPEQAEAQAAAATARWRQGQPMGVLDGVPVTVKELIATAGDPVPLGTAAVDLSPAPADAPCAARLREAGAIIFAKTTIPDYGMLSSGLSSFHTLARNPWNLATNPGGSSAGASAAAASCYGPIHVGTDIGGSVRLPAAWCGTVGFKPTLGRIPIDPYYTGRCAGPMTRGMADAALAMGPLTLPDSRDATSLPYEAIAWSAAPLSPAGLRVGVMLDAGCGLAVDAEIAAAIENAASLFARAGATIVAAPPVLTRDILDGIDLFWRAKFWDEVSRLPQARRARILPYILEWVSAGAHVTGVEAARGFGGTFALRQACAALFDTVDVVLSPTTPNLSFPADWASPTNDPALPFEHCAFTLPWNMSEQPALTLNCGFSHAGTPIGLQIVTRRFADLQAIRLGRWFEREYGRVPHWPGESPQPPPFP
ncbi:amidase [Gluconacetobacter aggeris]|uniref:Amidase n=1 Tax=Gluconacetobacter aggeris TaxID=1286186 RepID=A0A7W4ITM6_9PROT|nr:amidase [Gluconacetobacter aggeris]MBB2168849.1 amidase [Gluconacetobacter aggeris]